jgi:AcrR family transcriptional regulator
MKTTTRNKILDRASRLFFHEGLATGIDRVTAECGTAKMTIYLHFTHKDGLICAILRGIQTNLSERIRSHTSPPALPPLERLQAAFNILCYGMSDPDIMAGLLVRALLEFPRASHRVHRAALEVEQTILDQLEPLCAAAGIADSEQVGRQLLLVAKGCFAMTPSVGLVRSRMLASSLAEQILAPNAT